MEDLKKLRNTLFEIMSCEIGVMAEYGDDEKALREEIESADFDILQYYKELYIDD